MTTETLARGVYDMPADDYHAHPALSSSGARKLLAPSCPAIFDYERQHGEERKQEFDLGTAAHTLLLGFGPEPHVIDADSYRTKAAQQERDEAYARGDVPLLPKEFDAVQAMVTAVRQHPRASELLSAGKAEQSLFWTDPTTGVLCRARPDWLRADAVVDYKGLALDTPIPTPTGWTTMGALAIGDRVLDSSGRPCSVTAKSAVHYRPCYRVRFDDGASVICDEEHLWRTQSGEARRGRALTDRVHTTDEIRRTLKHRGQNHHRVPLAAALDLPDVELPIHPYVLGCWLGDGGTTTGRITKPDEELFEHIAACGYSVAPANAADGKCPTRTVYGLRRQLRLAGIFGHKSIPTAYLRAGYEQRLCLLRGLMDTDGSWNAQRRQAVFTSVDKALCVEVQDLALSLGQRAIVHTFTAHGYGITREAYRVTFTPVGGLNPFLLSRKADQVTVSAYAMSHRRVIVAVDVVPIVATQCIAVDSPDHTYLCTEWMIPTHNTTTSVAPSHIAKSVADFGYHQQSDWYLSGAAELELLPPEAPFYFIFQSKSPPHLIKIVELDEVALSIGRDRNEYAREVFRDCSESGVWPGYGDDIELISLPAYEVRRHYGGMFA